MDTVQEKDIIYIELKEILSYTDKKILNRIPQKILEKINSVDNSLYEFKYEIGKSLHNQKIHKKTKEILAGIYIKYCCNEEKSKILIEKCKENDEKKSKNFEINWKKKNTLKKENTDLDVIRQGFFRKILKKIVTFLK